jgi:trans-aconitate methyltransferase
MSGTTFWNPESYAQNARFVSHLGEPLLQLLDPKAGEVILDLGCGDGALTEKIVSFGATVYGVDSSYPQIQATRKRGLRAFVMDGHHSCLRESFDAIFSNAALHWMKQPARVLDGVHGALRAGGRFVGELGGKGNVRTIHAALYAGLRRHGLDPLTVDPWYYPSVEEYSQLLTQTGFEVIYIDLIPRPTKLPGDILGWLKVFAQPFSHSLAFAERDAFLLEVREQIKESLQNSDGCWFADYVRLRFKALKPSTR